MPLTVDIGKFPLSCIYALVDKSAGNAYVQYSTNNALNQLSRNVTELSRGVHDNKLLQNAYNKDRLELVVLKEYESPPEDIIIRCEAVLLFKGLGMMDMTGNYANVEYTIQKRVMPHYAGGPNSPPLVYVLARSRSPEAIVLGVFDNMMSADFWIMIKYKTGVVGRLKFGDTRHSRLYREVHGYKMIRFREKRHRII